MIDFEKFEHKKIAILWYGREGKSTLHFLLKIWVSPKDITILDGAQNIEGLAENLEKISKEFGMHSDVNFILWEKYLDMLKKFDLIIKTPGISLYHEKIYPYRHKISSQAQIFFDYFQGKILAVSGTKGKSTTSTLICETLKNAGKKVQLIGNIGNPVLDFLDIEHPASQKDEYVVFEVSSYMLEWLKKTNYISVLLNIYSDHIDWHAWFENYKAAKLNILNGSKYTIVRDEIIQNYDFDDNDIKEYAISVFWHTGKFSYKDGTFFENDTPVFDDKHIVLEGEHNMLNITAVMWVCAIMKIDYSILKDTLMTFKWLPHRMENVWMYGWIRWIDDAISTTPESTIQAIKTFWKKIDTIFLWWTDRGYVFDTLIQTIITYGIRNVVLFPDSGKRIFKVIKWKDNWEIRIFQTDNMQEAVKFAYKYTKMGKICLLSTASPSYSVWKNFEEKGTLFQKHIKALA